jgi:ABC-2 type transport system permease protein
MKLKRVRAILIKQLKDTFKNKTVLIQFIIFPVVAYIMTIVTGDIDTGEDMMDMTAMFATMFATMYVGMVPVITMASIIAEEKEKDTLRALMMSNVKPMEYMTGVGIYIFAICLLGAAAFGLIAGLPGLELTYFIMILALGVLVSLIMGGALGILSKNLMSTNSIVTPIVLVLAFIPMFSMFNESFALAAKALYTQQINALISDLSASNFTWDKYAIIGANAAIFFAVFMALYKKRGLLE